MSVYFRGILPKAALVVLAAACGLRGQQEVARQDEALREALGGYPHKLAFESFRDGNWEICLMDADGGNPKILTETKYIDELYPQATADGGRICFLADRPRDGRGRYDIDVMNIDGTGRETLVKNGRQPAWNRGGTRLAYMKGLERQASAHENEQLCFLDVATGEVREHPNKEIRNLMNLSWTPDDKWIVATVVAALGYEQAIIAVEVDGERVVELTHQAGEGDIYGCRPDVSRDGKRLAWGLEKLDLTTHVEVAELEYVDGAPRVVNERHVATFALPQDEAYHVDWSPDGRYIAFSMGPQGSKMRTARYVIGARAPGWNICVVDVEQPGSYVALTRDGLSNKEAEWVANFE